MGFVNYNGVMFGNRMSLNLLQQLKSLVPKDKQYLLDINDFLKFWIKGKISKREEKIFYTSLYGNKKENSYEEKKQNNHSLCSGASAADTWHGSRGENKAKTGSKEKDNDHRADIPFEIKRGV